ncbi:response regulator transcription factor [bacterium]|nr:MAG: response regulator transcription factor [bacterium]
MSALLLQGGYDRPQRSQDVQVTELSTYAPNVLLIDFDHLSIDPIESLRQLRFVLPDCTIAVLSSTLKRRWAAECHLAGASCLLAKNSSRARMLAGIRHAVRSGCYTDSGFIGAVDES